ncbi:MAG: NUDIX domain-containing protein, partial [Myxococcota bacterium]|nr:NUDIX domain-containing protein [Myxococcota bacterium]
MSRYFATDPHEVRLSVSAVVWRSEARRDLLLMQRSDNAQWGLPGGYVEPGESVETAAAREVYEETGVRIEVGRLVGVYSDPTIQVIEYPDGRRVHA